MDGGIILIKYWLEVGKKEQQRRFEARIEDPLRQWKLSPMDLESFRRWYDYSHARDRMLEATDTKHAPWYMARQVTNYLGDSLILRELNKGAVAETAA